MISIDKNWSFERTSDQKSMFILLFLKISAEEHKKSEKNIQKIFDSDINQN